MLVIIKAFLSKSFWIKQAELILAKEYILFKVKINSQFLLLKIFITLLVQEIDKTKSTFLYLSKKWLKLVINSPLWAFLISIINWKLFKS